MGAPDLSDWQSAPAADVECKGGTPQLAGLPPALLRSAAFVAETPRCRGDPPDAILSAHFEEHVVRIVPGRRVTDEAVVGIPATATVGCPPRRPPPRCARTYGRGRRRRANRCAEMAQFSSMSAQQRPLPAVPGTGDRDQDAHSLEVLLSHVARGGQDAFSELYDRVAGQVYGVVRRVVRDPAQSEEVAQEVLVEVWRSAARFDPSRGTAATWILTIAHRRAVDRVRAAQAAIARDERAGRSAHRPAFDEVIEQVETRLEHEQVRQALSTLTDLQREAVTLAYYGGYTYREVSELLDVPLGTVKTRLRDGLIRLRDAMGVES